MTNAIAEMASKKEQKIEKLVEKERAEVAFLNELAAVWPTDLPPIYSVHQHNLYSSQACISFNDSFQRYGKDDDRISPAALRFAPKNRCQTI